VRVRLYQAQEEGEPLFIGIARDCSQEASLVEQLHAGEDFYRHVIDSAVDGFFQTNARQQFVEVNDRLCELFGYPRSEWLGKTPFDFITPASRQVE